MYRIVGNRSTGKTNSMLLLAKETGATIVCRDPRRLIERAHAYGITGLKFMSYEDLVMEPSILGDTDALIDDLEDLAQFLTNHRTIGYTLSKD